VNNFLSFVLLSKHVINTSLISNSLLHLVFNTTLFFFAFFLFTVIYNIVFVLLLVQLLLTFVFSLTSSLFLLLHCFVLLTLQYDCTDLQKSGTRKTIHECNPFCLKLLKHKEAINLNGGILTWGRIFAVKN